MYSLLNNYIEAEKRNVSLLKQRYKDLESNLSSNTLVERIKVASDIITLEDKINRAQIKQIIVEVFYGYSPSNEKDYSVRPWSLDSIIHLLLYMAMLTVLGILLYKLIKGTL